MTDKKRVFLAGVTGFVGKVVLSELMRRRDELGVDHVFVLIRPGRNRSPAERFDKEVASSACFAELPPGWSNRVSVVSGELTEPGLAMDETALAELSEQVTQIIHCAATVEFDLPLQEAASANITGSLNVLEMAKRCRNLQTMISCSTSYVTPFPGKDIVIGEQLVDLPFSAEATYRDILDGRADQDALMAQTGLPNTYTLSKCIAEHLLTIRQGSVPLVIVRPSIISASLQYPVPGWIDSSAAFAGFVMLIGAGYLRTVVGDRDTLLDIVPCDAVATRLIDAAFGPSPNPADGPQIRQVVAGNNKSCTVGECADEIVDFFRQHPVARHPHVSIIGPNNRRFALREWQQQRLPAALARTWFGVSGQSHKASEVSKLNSKLGYLNRAFPYFTHNSFNFGSSVPLERDFSAKPYLHIVCRGVFRHLMRGDESQLTVAGSRHQDGKSDLRWVMGQPDGNWAIRIGSYVVRKAFRKMSSRITFDKPSFERARAAVNYGDLMIVVPTHRSYVDFLVCSYLFFARPDLGIAIPHIAATDDFARIPLLGWLFKQMNAFYIRRGTGREDPQLTQQITDLASNGETLQFFIEGTRSRSRQFLQPKRGLLRALQKTGQRCVVLPLAISYDRVPEEQTFISELTGAPKPKMTLSGLLVWSFGLVRGKVNMGRVHVACGEPQLLDRDTDVHDFSRRVMAQLQSGIVTTSHHLKCFLQDNPIEGIDIDWLQESIARRGGQVFRTALKEDVHPVTERCMRFHWEHLYYGEALVAFPDHPAIAHHIALNGFQDPPIEPELWDSKIMQLLRVLFDPVAQDYLTVARSLGNPTVALHPELTPRGLVSHTGGHLPTLAAAFQDLTDREILVAQESGGYAWGPKAADIDPYRKRCVGTEQRPATTAAKKKPSAGMR